MPKKMVVLVVDDNQDGANTMAHLLTVKGCEVHVAYNGATAVKQAGVRKPALVLLDIRMSGIDGFETCAAIRGLLGPAVRIVAVTGETGITSTSDARAAHFDDLLGKPVNWTRLDEIIRAVAAATKG